MLPRGGVCRLNPLLPNAGALSNVLPKVLLSLPSADPNAPLDPPTPAKPRGVEPKALPVLGHKVDSWFCFGAPIATALIRVENGVGPVEIALEKRAVLDDSLPAFVSNTSVLSRSRYRRKFIYWSFWASTF